MIQTREVIILAGGLGLRLRAVSGDLPKCLAPVNGQPFLGYLVHFWVQHGCNRFIFALGYQHQQVTDYLGLLQNSLHEQGIDTSFTYSCEPAPMGTGGAIRLAMAHCQAPHVWICNGDSLFLADLQKTEDFHLQHNSIVSLTVKPMANISRYGSVTLQDDGRVTGWQEKGKEGSGLLNSGIYLACKTKLDWIKMPEAFSWETDFLPTLVQNKTLWANVQDVYFIDIGIPEDFERAQHEIPATGWTVPNSPKEPGSAHTAFFPQATPGK